MKNASKHGHPAVWDLHSELRRGKITRREFLRDATLLGMSVGLATVSAQCGPLSEPGPSAGSSEPVSAGSGPKRGGTLRIAMPLDTTIDHPARIATAIQANIVRQVSETLTAIGVDNIVHPYLLERWETSEDLRTWTLHLRQGVTFNNGAPLTADDVLFTFNQWLDPEVGSSMLGLLSYLGGIGDVEKVDDVTIKLHLQKPSISLPQDLASYPAVILPHTFAGDFLKQPVGTGAFTLKEFVEGERAILQRRADYWRPGQDGQPLPYLDEIHFFSLDRTTAAITAMLTDQVDTIHASGFNGWLTFKDEPRFSIYPVNTANAFILRMRSDVAPWNDARTRTALKLCQDRKQILRLARQGAGELSLDAHVAPIHPAYCQKPIPKYDPEQAKALLAEAGYAEGLKATLTVPNDLDPPNIAQALQKLAAPGGFDLSIELVPTSRYWEQWTTIPLGITSWGHRPLDTTVLRLAYTVSADGNPGAWNETHWVDEEFNSLLNQAEGTLDIAARRQIMCQLEDIMQERGPMGNSYWLKDWKIMRSNFRNVQAHPSADDLTYEIWKDG